MPDTDKYDILKIREVVWETPEALTLIFETPGKAFHYKPGQYITLILKPEGKEEKRYFSLPSSPHTDPFPFITVKKTIDGRSSWLFFQQVKPGALFSYLPPAGKFSPPLDENHALHYVFFAGGSGITPLISMIKSILAMEPNSHCTLVYQNRNENSIIYRSMLNEFVKVNPGRFRVIHILSQPDSSWPGRRGRINRPMIADIITEIPELHVQEGQYYICGPKGMEAVVKDALKFIGVPGTNIRLERY